MNPPGVPHGPRTRARAASDSGRGLLPLNDDVHQFGTARDPRRLRAAIPAPGANPQHPEPDHGPQVADIGAQPQNAHHIGPHAAIVDHPADPLVGAAIIPAHNNFGHAGPVPQVDHPEPAHQPNQGNAIIPQDRNPVVFPPARNIGPPAQIGHAGPTHAPNQGLAIPHDRIETAAPRDRPPSAVVLDPAFDRPVVAHQMLPDMAQGPLARPASALRVLGDFGLIGAQNPDPRFEDAQDETNSITSLDAAAAQEAARRFALPAVFAAPGDGPGFAVVSPRAPESVFLSASSTEIPQAAPHVAAHGTFTNPLADRDADGGSWFNVSHGPGGLPGGGPAPPPPMGAGYMPPPRPQTHSATIVISEEQFNNMSEENRRLREILTRAGRMGPAARVPVIGGDITHRPEGSLPPAPRVSMSVGTLPDPRLGPLGKTAIVPHSGSISTKDIPTFTATAGIIPHLKRRTDFMTFFNTYMRKLEEDPQTHVFIILSKMDQTALLWLMTHAEAITSLCPESAPYLMSMKPGTSMASLAAMYAKGASTPEGGYRFPAVGHTSPTSSLLAQFHTAQARGGGSHPVPFGVGIHTQGVHRPGSYGFHRSSVPEGRYPFTIAILCVAEDTLCYPVQGELEIWKEGLKLGVSNEFDPTVPPHETPEQFLLRVLTTEETFAKWAPDILASMNLPGPYETYLKGLPAGIAAQVRDKMRPVSHLRTSVVDRLGMAAQIANGIHEDEILSGRGPGRRATPQAGAPGTASDAAKAVTLPPKFKQTLMEAGLNPKVAGHIVGCALRGDTIDLSTVKGTGLNPTAALGTATPQGGAPHRDPYPGRQLTRPTPGQGTPGNNPRPGTGQQGGDRQPRGQPSRPCRVCGDSHWDSDCPTVKRAQELMAGKVEPPKAPAPPGPVPPTAAVANTRPGLRPAGASTHVHFEGEVLEADHWAHALQPHATLTATVTPVGVGIAPIPTCTAAYADQRRMPVSWADPGPGLDGQSKRKQELALLGMERAAAIAVAQHGTSAHQAQHHMGPTPPAVPAPSDTTFAADRPISFEVILPFDSIGSTASPMAGAITTSDPPGGVALATSTRLLQPRTVGQYCAGLTEFQRLRYLRQPADSPSLCLGLLGGDGSIHTDIWVLVDDGSDINLITEATCLRLGIPIYPTSIRLTTSNGDSGVIGITRPIPFTYGVGAPFHATLTVSHSMLVVRRMDHVYEVLLGNIDTQRFDGIIDSRTQTYTLRLSYSDDEIIVSLPTMYAAPRRLSSVHGAQ